jgi:hypothetical protein
MDLKHRIDDLFLPLCRCQKKPSKLDELGGLHPVFLTPEKHFFLVSRKEMRLLTKAGLLAPPPFQSPSHPASAEKWP